MKKLKMTATKKSFLDLAAFLYISYATGDESFGILSPEYHTVTTSLTVIFYELLKDVSGKEYTMVLDFICRLLGLEEYLGIFTKYTGDGIAKLEGINFFVSGVLSALILQFTTDPAPADNNVTLPGYIDNTAEPEVPEDLTFREKIVKFFKDIFSYLVRILGF